jgi:hypothetical protein
VSKKRRPGVVDPGRDLENGLERRFSTKTSQSTQTSLAVYSGRECIGHVLNRGHDGYEAFDQHGRSLGLFATTQLAASAISAREGKE